jgi:hypothetical protein
MPNIESSCSAVHEETSSGSHDPRGAGNMDQGASGLQLITPQNCLEANGEHFRDQILGHSQLVVGQAVETEQQPSKAPLFHRMTANAAF